MSTLAANGVDLYYEDKGAGMPILCIHGTSSSALVWARATDDVAEHGRCLAYDRRGCFRSERPDPYETTDVTEHTDDALALLHALSATPAVVIGRSYGGLVALDMARRFPQDVRAMALLEPAMFALDPEAQGWAESLRQRVLELADRDPSSVGEFFLRSVAGDDAWESFPEEIKDMFRANGPAIVAELRGRTLDLSTKDLAGIRQPALIVSSTDSAVAYRRVDERLAHALPRAEHVFVRGSHLISPADPAVLRFVDGVVGSAPG